VDREWLRAEAARLGLALTEEDLGAIAEAIEKTRTELAAARRERPEWNDPAIGFLPLSEDPSA
jgi:hypothetical protein